MMKQKRIEDKPLLDTVRAIGCMACVNATASAEEAREFLKNEGGYRSHPHHLISKGAGGNDVAANLIPLCPYHHVEIHTQGIISFSAEYQSVQNWLNVSGWEYEPFLGWAPPKGVRNRTEDSCTTL